MQTSCADFCICREKGHTYGKLAPQAINSAAAADGEANFASIEKRNKSDFALWKQAKAGEPAWDSPECAKDEHGNLGKGRPGAYPFQHVCLRITPILAVFTSMLWALGAEPWCLLCLSSCTKVFFLQSW